VRAQPARRHEVDHGVRVSRRVRHGDVWTRGRGFPLSRLETRLRTPICGPRDGRLIFAVPRERRRRVAKRWGRSESFMRSRVDPIAPHVRCRVEALAPEPPPLRPPRRKPARSRSRLSLPDCRGESEHSAICQLPFTDTRQTVLMDRESRDPTCVPDRKKKAIPRWVRAQLGAAFIANGTQRGQAPSISFLCVPEPPDSTPDTK
jgi:hypothetical protein